MTNRFLFVCPDRESASGGIAVIYDVVALLNRSGHEAAVVHNSPGAGYPDYPEDVPSFYTRRVRQTYRKHTSVRGRIKMLREKTNSAPARLPKLVLRPTDVIVAPEFQMAEALEAFQGWPIAVFVQNPFALMRSYDLSLKRGIKPQDRVSFWLGMSEVCRSHMDVLGLQPSAFFPVTMKPHEFPFQAKKKPLISYMPRKRPREAGIIAEALHRRGNVAGYSIEALDNIPREKVAERLSESRIFISLLHNESLGFPAAEAMASGAIVVGFDGLGGAEFFDESTGFPVAEGDVAGVVTAVEQVVAEYEANPTRLDIMRNYASDLVNERYSVAEFEVGVLRVWTKMQSQLKK